MTEQPKRRKTSPFRTEEPKLRDPRIPDTLWELPRRVEQANRNHGWNQSELASRAELSQSVLSKLSKWDNLYGLRLETLYKLAHALNVSVPYLLGEDVSTTDTKSMAEEAASMFVEIDGMDPDAAWLLLRGIELSDPSPNAYYIAARRRLSHGQKHAFTAEDATEFAAKVGKLSRSKTPLGRRKK